MLFCKDSFPVESEYKTLIKIHLDPLDPLLTQANRTTMYRRNEEAFSGDAPVVEGAWPEQQPTRDGHRLLLFGLGEAAAEVEGQDNEEWNVPGMEKEAAVT